MSTYTLVSNALQHAIIILTVIVFALIAAACSSQSSHHSSNFAVYSDVAEMTQRGCSYMSDQEYSSQTLFGEFKSESDLKRSALDGLIDLASRRGATNVVLISISPERAPLALSNTGYYAQGKFFLCK